MSYKGMTLAEKINKINNKYDKLFEHIKNATPEEAIIIREKTCRLHKSSINNQNYVNTNYNYFTNDKNCNNVVYIGSYKNINQSRNSSNIINDINYGPRLF